MPKKRHLQRPLKLSGMDEQDFLKLLKSMGFRRVQTDNNEYHLSVYHQKNTKSFVKPCYVKALWSAYEETTKQD